MMSKTKKLLAKVLVLCMVIGMIPATMLAANAAASFNNPYYGVQEDISHPVFKDVPSDAWYAKELNWALEKGITEGTGDGTTFGPKDNCTENQMLTFLWRVHGAEKVPGVIEGDGKEEWYSQALLWAKSKGLIPEDFEDDGVCTRAEMVVWLWQLDGSPEVEGEVDFTDVDPGSDYYAAVVWAVSEGITKGTNDDGTTFSPDKGCNRAEMVTFLYRAYAE